MPPASPLAAFLCLGLLLSVPAVAADPTAPPTRSAPVVDRYHGVAVADPYRWLEATDTPEVAAWSAAQDRRTRAYLDANPQRSRILAEITALADAATPSYSALTAAGGRLFALATEPPKQQPLVLAMGPDADPARALVVIDPNRIDPTGQTAIDWFVPSPDGRLVGASLSRNGSEDGSIHVFETTTGRELGQPVPRAQFPTAGGSLAWRAEGTGFWYTRYPGAERPEADRHFFQQVAYHHLGDDPAQDPIVAGQDLPRIAEIVLDSSTNPHAVLMSVELGDGGQYAQSVIDQASGRVTKVSDFADGVVGATIGPDDTLYLVSRKGAPRGRLLSLPLAALSAPAPLSRARLLVDQGDGVIEPGGQGEGEAVTVTPDRLYLRELIGGPSRVSVFGHDGSAQGVLALPPVSAVGGLSTTADGDLLAVVQSYVRPQRVLRIDGRSGAVSDTKLDSSSPARLDDIDVTRGVAVSKDGTRVPFTMLSRKGMRHDGSNPTLLYGYGGYGVSETPRFNGAMLRPWFDAGGVYVDTNLRGGGEFGAAWHDGGALTHKQHVFDDFLAVAHLLIDQHVTAPAHLAILGGSNGGLLMGAALTQAPELFHAVVSQVGIYDMMRIELDANGAFNTAEFGSVRDADQFRAMLAYSPYQAVRDGVAYPAVFMATGTHDGRVNPAQSRKMIARLQAATSSGRPVYLSISDKAGHGIGSALNVRLGQTADLLAFLFDQLGMRLPQNRKA